MLPAIKDSDVAHLENGSKCQNQHKERHSQSICSLSLPLMFQESTVKSKCWIYAVITGTLALCFLCVFGTVLVLKFGPSSKMDKELSKTAQKDSASPDSGVEFMNKNDYNTLLKLLQRLLHAGYDLDTVDVHFWLTHGAQGLTIFDNEYLPGNEVFEYTHGMVFYDKDTQICVYISSLDLGAEWQERVHQAAFLLLFDIHHAQIQPHVFYQLPHQAGRKSVLLPPLPSEVGQSEEKTAQPEAMINHGGPNINVAELNVPDPDTAENVVASPGANINHGGPHIVDEMDANFELPEGAVLLGPDDLSELGIDPNSEALQNEFSVENTRLTVFPDGSVGAVYLGDNAAQERNISQNEKFTDEVFVE